MRLLFLLGSILACNAIVKTEFNCALPLPNSFRNEKGGLTLNWGMVDSRTMEIEYVLPGSAFIGIGFGISMTQTDMVLGWVYSNGSFAVSDYYSLKRQRPSDDVSLGGKNDITPVCGMRVANQTVIRFRRLLNTGDKFDVPIAPSGPNDMVYAWLDGTPGAVAFHGDNHNHIQVDFSQRDGVPKNTFGEEEVGLTARQLVNTCTFGTLVTLQTGVPGQQDSKYAGFPFGSVASFADQEPSNGKPLLLLSQLERNVINYNDDSRCSLAVQTPVEQLEGNDPMAAPRMTLLGTLIPVPDDQYDQAKKTYLAKHPTAMWIDFPDFSLYYFNATDVYWVGGFGNEHYIGWVDVNDYLSQKV
jgi:hypothetical protein